VAAAAIPQFVVRRDVPVDAALAALERARAAGGKATLSDVIVSAAARAALERPRCNAWFVDDATLEFEQANAAFAVDAPDGVVAPVIRAAESLGLAELARRRADLVRRAREDRLAVEDLLGATFTISNVGPLAADDVVPLLTPPQAVALGVGRVRRAGDESVVTATFVGDHRALDGADGARYLGSFADAVARLGETLA
jgi:pyruvate dehydrogenase E2 component (dihydrolipoamide acetyltransferase)